MRRNPYLDLGRRERQIMDAVYRLGIASVAEVREAIPNPPSYSAVRATLTRLEQHGQVRPPPHRSRDSLFRADEERDSRAGRSAVAARTTITLGSGVMRRGRVFFDV